MEYVYATLILNETNSEINETNITDVLEAAGAEEVVESRVKALVAALEGVDLDAVDPVAAAPPGRETSTEATADASGDPDGTAPDAAGVSFDPSEADDGTADDGNAGDAGDAGDGREAATPREDG